MKITSLLTHFPIHREPTASDFGAEIIATAEPVDPSVRVFRGHRYEAQTITTQAAAAEFRTDAKRIFRGRTSQPASALEGLNLSTRGEASRVFRGSRLSSK